MLLGDNNQAEHDTWYLKAFFLKPLDSCSEALTLACIYIYINIMYVWGFPKIRGTFWGPHKKDYNFLGVYIGVPYFDKLPYC